MIFDLDDVEHVPAKYGVTFGRIYVGDWLEIQYTEDDYIFLLPFKSINTKEIHRWIRKNKLPHWSEWTNRELTLFKLRWS